MLDWDIDGFEDLFDYQFEVAEYFDEKVVRFECVRDWASIAVTVYPTRMIVGICLRNKSDNAIILDIAVCCKSRVEVRSRDKHRYIYCHECKVVPGVNAYSSQSEWTFFAYVWETGFVVSMYLQVDPVVAFRVLDPSPHFNIKF